ncbi:MAG: TonB-dependent receptor [Bacteroidia bacterium]
MKPKNLLFAILLLAVGNVFGQNKKVTLSGYIKEAGSGETLIGANVYLPDLKTGTTTNAYGFYSLTIPAGEYVFRFSYVGYQAQEIKINLLKNQVFDVNLIPATNLEEIVVTDDRLIRQSENPQMSVVELSPQQIRDVPTLFGEKDVMKTLQLMPGVQSGNEGQSGIYVRGGGPDQNLILLDEAVVYNASHLFGFFSVFNGDAVKNITLTKGGFPARYGGRLSSVVDISMKDGSKSDFGGEAGIGIISSKLMLEGPIVKDKASFVISGRRTYVDALVAPIVSITEPGASAGYYFYDFNVKLNYDIDRKNRLFLSGYFGKDAFHAGYKEPGFNYKAGLNWGNKTGTLRWNHQVNDKLFLNTSLILSDYEFETFSRDEGDFGDFSLRYSSSIRDYGVKFDADYVPSPNHKIKAGLQLTRHIFIPTAFVIRDSEFPQFDINRVARELSLETGIYVEDQWKITNRLEANLGTRLSQFYAGNQNYWRLEPRLSARYMTSDQGSVKAAFSMMNQYMHLLSNTGIGLPTDLWVPANDIIGPQKSIQYALGYAHDLRNKKVTLSAETYYKHSSNIITYKPGASFLLVDFEDIFEGEVLDIKWENQVTTGEAVSYGLELLAQKHYGRFNGWIGYTLSKTDWQFPEINSGLPFPARYDRRHDLSIVTFFEARQTTDYQNGIKISAVFVYGTGNAVTLPQANFVAPYSAPGNPLLNNGQGFWWNTAVDYGSMNSYRMAPYHRMDVSVQLIKPKSWGERIIEFSVYNLYNRANPWFLEPSYRNGQSVLVQYSLFGIVPSINYIARF